MMLETLGEFGKEFEIPCDVGGSPRPNVTWYRDAEPLSNIPAVRYSILGNNSLHINYMRREDSGMFQCSASNQAGYITGYTWLRVKSKWIYCSRFRLYDLSCFCYNLNRALRTLN